MTEWLLVEGVDRINKSRSQFRKKIILSFGIDILNYRMYDILKWETRRQCNERKEISP